MDIDDNLRAAISRAAAALGSQNELALRAGITPAMISKYLNGGTRRLERRTADRLLSIVRQYASVTSSGNITAQLLSPAPTGLSPIALAIAGRLSHLSEDECWEVARMISDIESRRKNMERGNDGKDVDSRGDLPGGDLLDGPG